MRIFLCHILLFVLAQGPSLPSGSTGSGASGGPPALVGSNHIAVDCGIATTCSATFPSPVGTGHLLGCAVFDGAGLSVAVTCSDGTSNLTQAITCNITTDQDTVAVFYELAPSSSAFTFTFKDGSLSFPKRIAIWEMQNVTTLDKTACADSTGTTPSSGNTPTTTANNEFVYGFVGNSGVNTISYGSGYTGLDTAAAAPNSRVADEYKIVSATGAYAATFGMASSTEAGTIAVTFK